MIAVIAGLVIALPTRLVPNGFFRRMTPTRPLDYLFWIIASALLGLVLALRATDAGRQDAKAVTAGFGAFRAVGGPVWNRVGCRAARRQRRPQHRVLVPPTLGAGSRSCW